MKMLPLLLFAAILSAQPKLTLAIAPSVVKPGGSGTLTVSLSRSAGIAGLEWSVGLPVGMSVTPSTGTGSTAAGKSVTCGSAVTPLICLSVGLNTTEFTDGVVASYAFTVSATVVPGQLGVTLTQPLGVSATGDPIPVTADVPAILAVQSPCDLNGDGKTDVADMLLAIGQAMGAADCATGDLDGNGKCDIYDVFRVIVPALGGVCKVGR